jgi:hypothetical protein
VSLEDRLAAQRQVIASSCEEPVNVYDLIKEIRVFADLLVQQTDRFNDTVIRNIQKVQVQACKRIRPDFMDTYKFEYLKAAMWLAGLYDSVYLD